MKRVLVVAGFLALAGLLVVTAAIWKSVRGQERLMAALQAKGYPTTMAELNPPYESLPTELNAAAYFEAAGRVQTLCTEPHPKLPEDATTPLSEEQMGVLARWLEANRTALDYLHKGAALEKARFSFSYGTGTGNFRSIDDVVLSADLLHWEAMYRAEQGDAEGAVEAILATLRLGRSLAPYPVVIAHINRYGCCDNALVALDRCLGRMTFSEPQLARLASALAALERELEPSLARTIAGEMLYYSHGHPMSGWLDARYRCSMGKLVLAAEAPLQERTAKLNAAMPSGPSFLNPAVLVAPQFVSALQEIDLKQLAKLRAARSSVALERYRLVKGSLPDALETLVPTYLESVPLDPFDGHPLRYKRLNSGYVVYSVSVNGTDDGGTPSTMRGIGDDAFRLYR